MACESVSLKGISNDCLKSMGGVKEIKLAPWKEFDGTISNGEITELDISDFKTYYTKKNVSSMTSTYNIDVPNGVNYVSTELNLVFARMSADKRLEINALATSDLRAIVTDSNNTMWYLGMNEPIILTAGTGQTGVAKTDGNNYNLTFTDESAELPFPLSASAKLD